MDFSTELLIDLLTPISLLIIAWFAFKIWKLLINPDKGKRPPGFDKPSDHSLFIRKSPDGTRWILVRDPKKEDLAGPIIVKPGNKITFQVAPDEVGIKVHLQFPSNQLFSDFQGADCWIPDPIEPGNSLTVTVVNNRLNFGSHVYCIAVISNNSDGPRTPYVLGGSPPEIIVVHA